jgi:CHAP domain
MSHLNVAATQLGIIEQKNNSGPDVEKYLASVGLKKGTPWCMAFVYWCCLQAQSKGLVKTGSVLKQWHGVDPVLKKKVPAAGDIFIMDFGGGKGHTGFVKSVNIAKETFETIEGNSDAKGSRTGGMVCSNNRKIKSCIGFIRI